MVFEATYKNIDFSCLSGIYTPSYSFGVYTSSYKMPSLFNVYNPVSYSPSSLWTGYYGGSSPMLSFVPSRTSYAPLSYAPGTSLFVPKSSSSGTPSYSPKNFGTLTASSNLSSDVGTVAGGALFDKALAFVLKREGGYANVKGDSGGETNKGITKATYNAWLNKNGLPAKSVRDITDKEVRSIYYNEFWKPLGCDKLPSKVALFIFDTGVNMGVGRAKEYLRRYRNGENLNSLVAAREQRYEQIAANSPQKQKFLKGWMNRMADLKSTIAVA